jgi:hypothetical protein
MVQLPHFRLHSGVSDSDVAASSSVTNRDTRVSTMSRSKRPVAYTTVPDSDLVELRWTKPKLMSMREVTVVGTASSSSAMSADRGHDHQSPW